MARAAARHAAVDGAAMGAATVRMVGIARLVGLDRLVELLGLEMRLGIVAVLKVTRRGNSARAAGGAAGRAAAKLQF